MASKQELLFQFIKDNIQVLSAEQLDSLKNLLQTMLQELDLEDEQYVGDSV